MTATKAWTPCLRLQVSQRAIGLRSRSVMALASGLLLWPGCERARRAGPESPTDAAVQVERSRPPVETQTKTRTGKASRPADAMEQLVRNPFVSAEELLPRLVEPSPTPTPPVEPARQRIEIKDLRLTAIFHSPDHARAKAIIDGEILQEGAVIDDKKIISIQPESVMLQDASGDYLLRLAPIFVAGESTEQRAPAYPAGRSESQAR